MRCSTHPRGPFAGKDHQWEKGKSGFRDVIPPDDAPEYQPPKITDVKKNRVSLALLKAVRKRLTYAVLNLYPRARNEPVERCAAATVGLGVKSALMDRRNHADVTEV